MALTQVASGLIASVSGSTLTGTQTIPRGTLPTGSVLQVVNATYSTEISTTSTSYATTNLTASITPTSATSKILVLTSAPIGKNGSSGINLQLWRNSGSISQLATNMGYDSTSNNFNGYCYVVGYLDSPATTSSTSYTLYYATNTSGQSAKVFANSALGTITLMEIAA
jgi:hypothetical protein